jgi:peroxiredoxin
VLLFGISSAIAGEADLVLDTKALRDANTFAEVKALVDSKLLQIAHSMGLNAKGKILVAESDATARIQGGERIIEVSKDDKEREVGVKYKVAGLKSLVRIEGTLAGSGYSEGAKSKGASQKYEDFLKQLEREGKFLSYVNDDKYHKFFSRRSAEVKKDFTLENFTRFVNELKQWSNTKPIGIDPFIPLNAAARTAGLVGAKKLDPDLEKKTIRDLMAFVQSDKSTIPSNSKSRILAEFGRLLTRAAGTNLQLYGKTLDGKDFDWKALRGKYVIVHFTTSKNDSETSKLKAMYEKYHDKGLEIVSIFGDDVSACRKMVKEKGINWITLSEELTKKANLSPLGKVYSINVIPTIFIVDKGGKVLSSRDLRGMELKKEMAKLFDDNQSDKTEKSSMAEKNTAKELTKRRLEKRNKKDDEDDDEDDDDAKKPNPKNNKANKKADKENKKKNGKIKDK